MSNTETETPTGKAPTHIAYQIRETGDRGYWTRIGAAWAHRDGNGFNIQLDSLPIDGKINLRIPTEKE